MRFRPLALFALTAGLAVMVGDFTAIDAQEKLNKKNKKKIDDAPPAKPDPADKDQLVGLLWNADRVKPVGKPMRVPLRRRAGAPAEEIWRRAPYAAKFSFAEKKTDIVVIPVHMKSNLGGEEAPEESVEFVYGAMGIKYTPQNPDGTPATDKKTMAMWSQTTNQPNLEVVSTEPFSDADWS